MKLTDSDLRAALAGYEHTKAAIESRITDIRRRLGQEARRNPGLLPRQSAPQKKHQISPEGRARIAEAQKRRWAAAKKGA